MPGKHMNITDFKDNGKTRGSGCSSRHKLNLWGWGSSQAQWIEYGKTTWWQMCSQIEVNMKSGSCCYVLISSVLCCDWVGIAHKGLKYRKCRSYSVHTLCKCKVGEEKESNMCYKSQSIKESESYSELQFPHPYNKGHNTTFLTVAMTCYNIESKLGLNRVVIIIHSYNAMLKLQKAAYSLQPLIWRINFPGPWLAKVS